MSVSIHVRIALVAAALAVPVAGQELVNGDMSEGYIAASGDTMPMGWGTKALRGGCLAGFDQEVFHEASASFRITGSDTCNKGFTQALGGVTEIEGTQITLSGWIRHENVWDNVQVAVVRACGGGGYKELPNKWVQMYRGNGTTDWVQFSGTATVGTTDSCDALYSLRYPLMVVNLYMRGTGKVWIDDLVVTGPGTRQVLFRTGARTSGSHPIVRGAVVLFESATSYTLTLTDTRGRLVREHSADGITAQLTGEGLSPGTYLYRVRSGRGSAEGSIAVR